MSLSLALGILVGDVGGFKLLTRAHAEESPCGDTTLVSESVNIEDGRILNGMTVRNVTVNGTFLEQAVIAGSVQLVNATVEGSTSLIQVNGVIVGSGSPCTTGVIVGSGGATTNGVIVGSGGATTNGVIVGSGGAIPNLSGVTGNASGTAVGGTLTGDGIVITNGFITGQNLLLSGATLDQGSINGTIASVTITPGN